MISFPRICISSTQGGGGKTLLSLGLTRALVNHGLAVTPFKKGPDYIDAAWLGKAAICHATNLDLFFQSGTQLLQSFCQARKNPDALAIIEGNRGLYDGLNETGECSTAQIARILQCPIILCIDCVKATRTIAAIIHGMTSFEPGLQFAGIVLNRIGSAKHEASLRKAIAASSSLPILGALPRLPKNPMPERHMGLACQGPALHDSIDDILDNMAAFVADHCDLPKMLAAAKSASPLPCCPETARQSITTKARPVIGVVQDKALWFYYPENIRALEEAGCEIRYLSLLDDCKENLQAWQNLNGLYLGGGFPEDYGEMISQMPFLKMIASFVNEAMPVYAECGGMIALCQSLQWQQKKWPMAGIIPCEVIWSQKPVGLGYTEGEITSPNPWYEMGQKLRGHEFHYSSCHWPNIPELPVMKLSRGAGIYKLGNSAYDGICIKNAWASYTHVHAACLPDWANRFAQLAWNFMQAGKGH